MSWLRRNAVMLGGIAVIAYMLVPIVVIFLMSFNDSSRNRNLYSFQKFTFDNWLHPCRPAGMCAALGRSVEIGLLATVGATILGTMVAFALVRHDFVGRSIANLIIFLPMASPEIVMGSSLLALFVSAGFGGVLGFWTILIAHIMFCLSFVVVTVKARLQGLPNNLEQAAMDLYADERTTFRKITFPLVFPGILSAALLSFSLSFDDFIITNLNAGQTVTFPMYVWGAAQRGVPMQVNVIGTVMFLVALIAVGGGQLVSSRRRRSAA
jgi:spermidine/putrescine transport system permease protein